MILLKDITFWSVLVISYVAFGYQFAKLAKKVYRNWDDNISDTCTYTLATNGFMRAMVFPFNAVKRIYGYNRNGCRWVLVDFDIKDTWWHRFYMSFYLFFWSLRPIIAVIVWACFIVLALIVLILSLIGATLKGAVLLAINKFFGPE